MCTPFPWPNRRRCARVTTAPPPQVPPALPSTCAPRASHAPCQHLRHNTPDRGRSQQPPGHRCAPRSSRDRQTFNAAALPAAPSAPFAVLAPSPWTAATPLSALHPPLPARGRRSRAPVHLVRQPSPTTPLSAAFPRHSACSSDHPAGTAVHPPTPPTVGPQPRRRRNRSCRSSNSPHHPVLRDHAGRNRRICVAPHLVPTPPSPSSRPPRRGPDAAPTVSPPPTPTRQPRHTRAPFHPSPPTPNSQPGSAHHRIRLQTPRRP